MQREQLVTPVPRPGDSLAASLLGSVNAARPAGRRSFHAVPFFKRHALLQCLREKQPEVRNLEMFHRPKKPSGMFHRPGGSNRRSVSEKRKRRTWIHQNSIPPTKKKLRGCFVGPERTAAGAGSRSAKGAARGRRWLRPPPQRAACARWRHTATAPL